MAIKFKNFDEEAEKRAKEIGAVKKNTATSSNTIAGVDSSITDKAYNSDFKESDDVKNAVSESGTALGKVKDLTSKDQIVSDDTWKSLDKQFSKPNAVSQADSYLSSQLQKIQSGKTSYTDQVRDMMDTIMGREKFTYDVDKDPLFQQALASAMGSGKTAMQDTIGQASALTGGYGSSYATSAANQAYNAFIEDAYNNLPQYYQMAMEAYQMEGDDLYRQLDMLTSADEREYSRNVTAFDATYQHRNQMYNEAYQQFRDAKNDAYNIANLKLSEHGQLVNDAYNYFNASADYANTLYEREYNKWADEINQAMMWAQMLNSDWWKQTEFGEGVRQYEKNFAEQQRQYNQNYNLDVDKFNETVRQYDENLAEEQRQLAEKLAHDDKWNQAELDYKNTALNKEYGYKYSALKQDQDQFDATMEYNKVKNSGSGSPKSGYVIRKDENGNEIELKLPTETQNKKALEAYNKDMEANDKNLTEYNKYLDSLSGVDEDTIDDYVATHGWLPFEERTYEKTKDTLHGFLGLQNLTGAVVDQGDIVVDQYNNEYDLADLAELGVSEDYLKELTKLKKGKSYTSKGYGGGGGNW